MKILLIDDTKMILTILRFALTKRGFDVAIAEDGVEGFKKFQEFKPDITVMDISMPNMNGLECLEKVMSVDKNAKVIMCSAIGQSEKIDQAMKLGAVDFIVKPFRDEDLLKKINMVKQQI